MKLIDDLERLGLDDPFNQQRPPHKILAGARCFDRFHEHSVLFKPTTCRGEEGQEHIPAQAARRFRSHGFSKEGVIPIPLSSFIQRLQKEASALQRFQKMGTIIPLGNSIAEWAGQTAKNACLEKKVLERLWLNMEYLRDKVFHNGSVAPGNGSE